MPALLSIGRLFIQNCGHCKITSAYIKVYIFIGIEGKKSSIVKSDPFSRGFIQGS
jgi:hypothetical protein